MTNTSPGFSRSIISTNVGSVKPRGAQLLQGVEIALDVRQFAQQRPVLLLRPLDLVHDALLVRLDLIGRQARKLERLVSSAHGEPIEVQGPEVMRHDAMLRGGSWILGHFGFFLVSVGNILRLETSWVAAP